jgi:4-diphosphocytidyl-2-C-methyl-D-erythritol kinase
MELKAFCKINLGLRVVRRRSDGFHDIETVMMPVAGLHDTVSVEALPTPETHVSLTPPPYPAPEPIFHTRSVLELSGPVEVDCPEEENICMRALRLLQREYGTGPAVVGLHKAIPTGAGLGGGSADAAAVLRAANEEFVLGLAGDEIERLAAELGSDVPFFVRASDGVRGGAQLCTGRGEIMAPVELDLEGLWLAIAKPSEAVSTAEAYAGVTPREGGRPLGEIVSRPVGEWRELLRNDFEESVFARHPRIGALKRALYDAGALYASMSGSGAAVYGLFDHNPAGLKQRLDQPFFRIERLTRI